LRRYFTLNLTLKFHRVFGTKGLRVIDGSVLQEKEVSVNQCTCQMLGALASEFIKDYWEQKEHLDEIEEKN
jgi:hypothetical protein